MKKDKFITEFADIPAEREKMPHLPLEERGENFSEVELGFDEKGAAREARRCLSCRRCIGCGLCLAECDPKAVVYDDKGRTLTLKVGAVVLAPGQGEFDAGSIGELGYRKYPNVITSMELERMLSPTGPYGGLALRPFDGQVPLTIGFIQCVGSRDEAIGADFCSSVCCMSAMKEALALAEQVEGARIKILHRDMRPLGKDSEEFYRKIVADERVSLVPAAVERIDEAPGSKNAIVEFSTNGEAQKEEFELVVLSVGMRPSASARSLSRKARVKLDKYGFCLTEELEPALTGKDGVVVAGTFTGPGDIEGSVCQARAAASAALQCLDGAVPGPPGAAKSDISSEVRAGRGNGVGVFVCKYGLSCSSSADAEELVEQLRGIPGVTYVASSEFLCVELSRAGFRDAIAEAGVSKALIVPCYEPTYAPLFVNTLVETGVEKNEVTVLDILSRSGDGKQSAGTLEVKKWVEELLKKGKEDAGGSPEGSPKEKVKEGSAPASEEGGKEKTRDSGALGSAERPEKSAANSALVIGGGLAGLTVALELSNLGHNVTLIEKGEKVGGHLLSLPSLEKVGSGSGESKSATSPEKEKDVLSSLREEVEAAERIDLLLSTELKGLSGDVGHFSASLKTPNGESTQSFGAIVVATGGREHIPDGLLHGEDDRVMTQLEFERVLAGGGVNVSSVVMIQCVGSRTDEWPVCSRTCCVEALKNALKVKELKPDATVTILHRDIRVYSMEEELLSEALEKGVEFIRVSDDSSQEKSGAAIELKADKELSVNFTELQSKSQKAVPAGCVVLSTGLRPQKDASELAGLLTVDVDEKGYFKEIHPELRPVESSRKGIYICGLAHSPQTAQDIITQAKAAAMKASSTVRRGNRKA